MAPSASKALKITNYKDFYKQMNFCPHYFESAVKHFYESNTPYETRYNSWVNCYDYFRNNIKGKTTLTPQEIDNACVQLGFYMASWGMYRGSSFLLQNDYTIYRDIIPKLIDPQYQILWDLDTSIDNLPNVTLPLPTTVTNFEDVFSAKLASLIVDIRNILAPYKDYYVHKSWYTNSATIPEVSKTLVTKLILGTIGCYPALDRYFGNAIGTVANDLKPDQIKCVIRLSYLIKKGLLSTPQSIFANCDNVGSISLSDYPVMKLIDMYYFTFGMEKPFLDLINKIITGEKTISGIIKEKTNNNRKLLKQFILYDNGSPKVDIAFPCSPLNINSIPIVCTYTPLDICNSAKTEPSNSSEINYDNIINKLTDKNGDLYKKLSKMKEDKEDETES